MYTDSFKYQGILFDKNLDIIDETLLEELVKLNIYKKSKFDQNDKKSYIKELVLEQEFYFGQYLFQINNEVLEEIYLELKNFVEEIKFDFEMSEKHLDMQLESYLLIEDKIKFLAKKYRKYHSKLVENYEVKLFLGEELWGYKNWKELILGLIEGNLISQHLKEQVINFNDDFIIRWSNYFSLKSMCDIILEKNSQLHIKEENDKKSIIKKNKSLTIFIDDGLQIFNYVVDNYPDELNVAFFSDLYTYLKERNKILNPTQTNKKYIRFVLKRHTELESFKRIIVSGAFNQNAKENRFLIFKEILKSYSQISE
jgi:hypothetical protein